MRLTSFIAILTLAYWAMGTIQPGKAKDYPVGSIFNDVIEFDYRSGKTQVPLPPGDWRLVAKKDYSSGGDAFSIAMTRLYLLRHTTDSLTGAIRINLPKDIIDSHWRVSKVCSSKRKLQAWYAKDKSFDRNENCSLVYPIRGFSRNSKRLKKMYGYIDQKNLTVPNSWVLARYYRTKGTDLLYINYALAQESYGFPRERKWSNNDSPWSINNIDEFPKKKAFMQEAVKWAKSWQRLVDLGFRNKLDRSAVLAHSKIDGTIAKSQRKSPARVTPPPSPSTISKPIQRPGAQMGLVTQPSSQNSDARLDSEQMKRLIVGRIAYGEGAQGDNILEFKNRGRLEGRAVIGQTDYYDDGSWLIDETGKICLNWNNEEFDKSGCFTTRKQGKRMELVTASGQIAYSVKF